MSPFTDIFRWDKELVFNGLMTTKQCMFTNNLPKYTTFYRICSVGTSAVNKRHLRLREFDNTKSYFQLIIKITISEKRIIAQL